MRKRPFFLLLLTFTIIAAFVTITFAALANAAPTPQANCISSAATVRTQDATIPQHGGGSNLTARLYAPASNVQTAPCPVLVIIPGAASPIDSMEWAATRFARDGYIVILVQPDSLFFVSEFYTAARSGIDYLLSADNPFLADSDTTIVGAAGYSMGANAMSWLQETDTRVQAVIGWDNLTLSEAMDEGFPTCSSNPASYRHPRVPAMGHASEWCGFKPPEAKKAAFNWWRQNDIPAMELVFAGADHLWWTTAATDAEHDLIHYYSLAWFDLWLKQDATAEGRLLAREILLPGEGEETAVSDLLSTQFTSALYFNGHDCSDWRSGCPDPATATPTTTPTHTPTATATPTATSTPTATPLPPTLDQFNYLPLIEK